MGVLYSSSAPSLDDLIAAAQADPADNSAAMAEILSRFSRDIAFVANTTATEWNLRQDAAQGARLGLVKAVRNHTPGTSGFKTYARLYMKSEARRTVDTMSSVEVSRDPAVLLDPTASERRPGVIRQRELPVEETAAFKIEDIIGVLALAQQSVVRDRYVHDRSMADIADDLGVSLPAISQRLKTIHKTLRPLLVEAVAA
jgi:RNA polymerase sigma factor (sigma-70 family)